MGERGDSMSILVPPHSQSLPLSQILVASLAPAPLPTRKGLGTEPANLLDYWHLEMEVNPLLSDLLFPVLQSKGKAAMLEIFKQLFTLQIHLLSHPPIQGNNIFSPSYIRHDRKLFRTLSTLEPISCGKFRENPSQLPE